jgi:YidC/Oxa1 family membrane protein insertase
VKEFHFTTNYLVATTVRWENRSDQPIQLPALHYVIGSATPLGPLDDGTSLGVESYDGSDHKTVGQTWFDNHLLSCACLPGTPREEYSSGPGHLLWAAVVNQFFAIAVVTKDTNAHLYAHRFDLPPPTRDELATQPKANKHPRGFQGALVFGPTRIDAGQALERQFFIFAGPKEYQTLAKLGAQFQNKLDMIMGYSGFFGLFSKGLLLSMNGLHRMGLSYAMAIIVITIIIKVLFWPLTQASTRSMKRLAALQPQMKALQEKYKDDPAKMQRKLMEFMKENKVSPLGGCLPMLLQMPVFIGFFYMIRSAIELRGARFLWVCDLSQPDTLFYLPGLNVPVNPLPLLMGATMLWQARLTPPSPGVDPLQQKMMKYMPLMFLFILYNFSAGLTLYWTVQNLLTIAQMKLTKTDAASTSSSARNAPSPASPPKKKK